MTRTILNQAVRLAICINRGYYLGTVYRDKLQALDQIKKHMSPDELREFNERIK